MEREGKGHEEGVVMFLRCLYVCLEIFDGNLGV